MQPVLYWKTMGVGICNLRYPTCNSLAPYCRLWPAPYYKRFPHYPIDGTIFEKKFHGTQNACYDFLYNDCLTRISFSKEMVEI
jgi:hypothetical protein